MIPHPKISSFDLNAAEWAMLLAALSAYRHNAEYRDLHDKLTTLAGLKAAGRSAETCNRFNSGAGWSIMR